MNEVLKNCPFCGRNAIYVGPAVVPFSGGKYHPMVMCNHCGAFISRSSKQAVIRAWNRRYKEGEEDVN